MEPETTNRAAADAAYSREFNGTPKRYLLASIATGVYLALSISLLYGLIRYYFLGDASVFGVQTLLYVGIFWAIYIPLSFRIMMKYDGQLSAGRRWVHKEVNVTLIETRRHRRFG